MKKENVSRDARLRRFDEAMSSINTQFILEADKTDSASSAHRAAPAWARPLAASVCAILAVGLLILSIPVVNNIITNRGTGALPADTPAAEQTAAFENTDAPKETVAPVETEKPEETEKEEETVEETDPYYRKRVISRLFFDPCNRNEKGEPAKVTFLITATLSDFLKDENRRDIITAEQLEKVQVGMTIPEMVEAIGYKGTPWDRGALLPVDDGRLVEIKTDDSYSKLDGDQYYKAIGAWDYEKDEYAPIPPELEKERQLARYSSAPIVSIEFIEDNERWEFLVDRAIYWTAIYYYHIAETPSWAQ